MKTEMLAGCLCWTREINMPFDGLKTIGNFFFFFFLSAYDQIVLRFGMVIITTELYTLMSVWLTLT